MLREAFGILALSEKDLDPRALEAVLTARLETAEFHDIPRLLEAYRTVNGLLETQMWYWNPETTSIHHQDGSTIELRGANASAAVMTAPPPSPPALTPPALTPPALTPPSAPQGSRADEVELITDGAPAIPELPAPAVRAAVSDDVSLVVDEEAETRATPIIPPPSPAFGSHTPTAQPFEESVRLTSRVEFPPAPTNAARAPQPEMITQPRINRSIPIGADDDLEQAHSTMVIVPPRRKVTAPWVVAVAAVGLAGGLWVLQSQTGRSAQRNSVAPIVRPSAVNTAPSPAPAPPVATKPATAPRAANPAPKPAVKPATAATKPAPIEPAIKTAIKPAAKPAPKPPALVSSGKPSAPKPIELKPTAPKPTAPKPTTTASAKPQNPTIEVTPPAATPKAATPASVRPKPVAVKPQPTPSFAPPPPAPKPVAVQKPTPVSPPAQVRPAAKPAVAVTRPAPQPAARPAPKPAAAPPTAATTIKPAQRPIAPRPKPVSVPAPVAVIEAPKSTGLPDNLTREEYGRRYFNQKIFEVWQRSGAQLRYATWEAIPLEIQTLDSNRFRSAVYIAPPPEPQESPK